MIRALPPPPRLLAWNWRWRTNGWMCSRSTRTGRAWLIHSNRFSGSLFFIDRRKPGSRGLMRRCPANGDQANLHL